MTDLLSLLQVASPDELLSMIVALAALSIVLYAYTQGDMVWITFGITAGVMSILLRVMEDILHTDLSFITVFIAGIVASTGYFMSAYRSWQKIQQTEEKDAAGRVELG